MASTNRASLRAVVRGAYDIQKLRMQVGLRVVNNKKAQLGQAPGEKERELDTDGRELLKSIRLCYNRLTDGITEGLKAGDFNKIDFSKGEDLISDATELSLVNQYIQMLEAEESHFKLMGRLVADFPIWKAFLEGVKGIGPAMAGVIISEIDISKAKYASSIWRYSGLDVSTRWVLQKTKIGRANPAKAEPSLDLPMELDAVEHDDECVINEKNATLTRVQTSEDDVPALEWDSPNAVASNEEAVITFERDGYQIEATYRKFHNGGRSRRKEHLVDVKYTDKDGKEKIRKGITFNPFLKTKLVGVLGTCFLRSRGCQYRKCYDDYKHRLENHPKHIEKSKGHRHNMAIRYMVKIFLIDLYSHWRKLEKLPVHPPYHEAKLGLKHDPNSLDDHSVEVSPDGQDDHRAEVSQVA